MGNANAIERCIKFVKNDRIDLAMLNFFENVPRDETVDAATFQNNYIATLKDEDVVALVWQKYAHWSRQPEDSSSSGNSISSPSAADDNKKRPASEPAADNNKQNKKAKHKAAKVSPTAATTSAAAVAAAGSDDGVVTAASAVSAASAASAASAVSAASAASAASAVSVAAAASAVSAASAASGHAPCGVSQQRLLGRTPVLNAPPAEPTKGVGYEDQLNAARSNARVPAGEYKSQPMVDLALPAQTRARKNAAAADKLELALLKMARKANEGMGRGKQKHWLMYKNQTCVVSDEYVGHAVKAGTKAVYSGLGVLRQPGVVYRGTFENCMPHGFTTRYEQGTAKDLFQCSLYEGQWSGNARTGHGVLSWVATGKNKGKGAEGEEVKEPQRMIEAGTFTKDKLTDGIFYGEKDGLVQDGPC